MSAVQIAGCSGAGKSAVAAALLPQRLQELLGFNQPTPYLGFINGRHPRDWLMNDRSNETIPSPADHD